MALAAMLALLGGCTPSTPTLTRAGHTPTTQQIAAASLRPLRVQIEASEEATGGPLACETDGSSCMQKIGDAVLVWSRHEGPRPVMAPIAQSWTGAGGAAGPWGAPASAPTCGAHGVCTQDFNGGLAVGTADTAHLLLPDIASYWEAAGAAQGVLGLPLTDQECGFWAGACRQQFDGGWVYTSPGGGTHRVLPALLEPWTSAGADTGPWGLPTGEADCTPSGTTCRQAFGGGEVTWRADVGVLDCRVQACVALTFDDGPGDQTSRLLDTLDAKGVQASFFVIGNHVPGNEAIVQRADALFNDVGVHSMTHTPMVDQDRPTQAAEWSNSAALVSGILGHPVQLGRPPYGLHNADTDATAVEAGLHLVWWDVDSLDWSLLNAQAVVEKVTAELKSGGVVLLHDVHATTVDAVGPLIDQLRAEGFVPVSLSELSAHPPG